MAGIATPHLNVPSLPSPLERAPQSVFEAATRQRAAAFRAAEASEAAANDRLNRKSAGNGPTQVHRQETKAENPPVVLTPAVPGLFFSVLPTEKPAPAPWENIDPDIRPWTGADAAKFAYGPFDIPAATTLETSFRHSGWAATRQKMLDALQRTGANANRQTAFCNCGSQCVVLVHEETGQVKMESNKCHDRFCQPCATERSRTIVRNLLEATAGKELRFITLTLKHCELRLNLHLDRLYTCFTRLRERSFWKEHVKGAAAFLEIKVSKDGRLWHPHIHILAEGRYIPKEILSSEWLAVTGDSYIIDVRYVNDPKKTAAYIAKYASKPLDPTLFRDPEKLDEAVVCLKGRRLCTTLGSWRGIELEKHPPREAGWLRMGLLDRVKDLADSGDPIAAAVIAKILPRRYQTKPEHEPDR